MTGALVGYDPGGNGSHGLALLHVTDGAPVGLDVETQEDAEGVIRRAESAPPLLGVGVDTLTCWSTGRSGWRPADRWLRARYPGVQRSVASPNTLYGSMSLNGMAVLLAVRRVQPGLPVTETHPKVLYYALTGRKYAYATQAARMDAVLSNELGLEVRTQNDHEWDAVMSTVAALRALQSEWALDLHTIPTAGGEQIIAPCGPTVYAWPD